MPETKKITLEFNEGAPSPEQLKALETFAKSIGATFQVASGAEDSKPAQTAPSIEVPKLPNGEPALWANRTTGREVSPVDFIKQNYGQTREDGSWDAMGLTRSQLRQLYQAFGTYVSRLQKSEQEIPKDLESLLEKPSERVEAELKALGISTPADSYKLAPDQTTADRLYQAARRRTNSINHD